MIPQVDNLPRNLVRNVAKYNIYDRDYRGLASPSTPLPLSSIRLIYERLGFPLICAKPRSLIVLSCNIIASVSGAARPVPHGRAHEILRRGRSKSLAATYSLGFVWVYTRIAARSKTTPVVSDFVHTPGVQGKSIEREILRPTEWTSRRRMKFVIYESLIFLEKGGRTLARGKVNLGVHTVKNFRVNLPLL